MTKQNGATQIFFDKEKRRPYFVCSECKEKKDALNDCYPIFNGYNCFNICKKCLDKPL